MNEHRKRLITAFIGIALVCSLYSFLHQLGLVLLTALISLAAYFEFLTILLEKTNSPTQFSWKRGSALFAGLCFLFLQNLKPDLGFAPLYFSLLLFLLTALIACHNSPNAQAFRPHLNDAMVQSMGFIYIVCFLNYIPALHVLPEGPQLLLFLLFIIWGGDSAAYYAGKKFGLHKLSLKLSPGKSKEGGIAAILFTILISVPFHFFALPNMSIAKLALLGATSSVIAQSGDLLESLVKRVGEVKDSGTLLPGHGGVYDRFDSLILATPFYYFLAQFLA